MPTKINLLDPKPSTPSEAVQAFERVRSRMQMKQERAAALMGVSRTRLIQILSGQGALTYRHLDNMAREADGIAFRDLFHQEMSKVWNVRDWDGVRTELIELTRVFRQSMRMAKATLTPAVAGERRTA